MFKGILKNFPQYVNCQNFKELIDKNIFVRGEKVTIDNDYFGLENGYDYEFSSYYQYFGYEYLFNFQVFEEYFNERINEFELKLKISGNLPDFVILELELIFDLNEKINYLKSILNDIYLKSIIYHIDLIEIKNNNIDFYKKYIYENLYDENVSFINILLFLNNEKLLVKNDFEFNSIHSNLYIIRSIEKKIIEYNYLIKNQNSNNFFKEDSRNDIFKEGAQKKFEFILNKYSNKKNTAFFSQLYHYLLDKNLINSFSKDNKNYREFIIKCGYLIQFSRIQERTSIKENSKWDNINSVFDDILKTYTE